MRVLRVKAPLRAALVLFCLTLLLGCAAKAPNQSAEPESAAVSSGNETAAEAVETSSDNQTVAVEESGSVSPATEGERLDPELAAEAPEIPQELTPQQEKVLEEKTSELEFELDVKETETFVRYFKYFTARDSQGRSTRGRRAFERWLERARPYLPYVREVIRQRGLPEDLIFLPFAESGYNPKAYSRAGAAGMWQFMPFTGRKYGLEVDWWIDQRRDPYKATHSAVDYLTRLHEMFDDWHLALAAYNAGEGRVGRAIKRSGCNDYFEMTESRRYLPRETRNYVPKILAILKIVKNLEELGFKPIDWNYDPKLKAVDVPGGTDLLAMADASGVPWKEFERLNPAYRRTVSPPDITTKARLPQDKIQPALAYLEKPESRPYAGYSRYKVRSGDSWWRISRRFHVPIAVLKQVNKRYSNLLKPGQWLTIPAQGKALAVDTSVEKTRQVAKRRANYTVCSGDTLWEIARAHQISLSSLKQANGLTSGRYLRVGQKLYIPGGVVGGSSGSGDLREITYQVRRGDTIWAIARRYNVNPSHLLSWNNLTRHSIIRPGQELTIKVD
ncbi:LysM peptidoglycan-binding domain-containing protein [Desulfohalovibrio reitneri]|uniref:LysM peptidoglycan-binding domain-containing protein n=1 Tax=Desulfohalovibrio reitneri TaxID=1307759 RepID=UPI0009DD964E|nr:LysM peptidoglycan-binding domain-containing protein [Desulfohalovibrio reitneri]